VNEIYVPNFLFPLITWICLIFLPKTYQQLWI